MQTTLARALVLSLVLSPLETVSADVLTVGPFGQEFTTIQAAVDAAEEGDTILVYPDHYVEKVTLQGKGLTLVGEVIDVPQVGPVHPSVHSLETVALEIADVPAGRSVLMRDFDFSSEGLPPSYTEGEVVLLRDSPGLIRLEDVRVQGTDGGYANLAPGTGAIRVTGCSSVGIVRSVFRAGSEAPAGLVAVASDVHVIDSTLRARDGSLDLFGIGIPNPGGHGARVEGGFLFASGCDFVAGDGGPSNAPGVSEGFGGDAVHAASGAEVRLLDCILVPGAGGLPEKHGRPIDGDAASLAQVLAGAKRLVRVDPIVEAGETFQVDLEGQPGDVVALRVSLQPQHVYVDALSGSLFLANPMLLVHQAVLDDDGEATVVLSAPSLPSAATAVFLQGTFVSGSQAVLGGSSMLVLLSP